MFPSRRATMGGDVFRDEFSLAFDGTNDYIELSGAFNYTNHAIVAWVKITADTTNKFIFDYRDGDNDGILLNINSSEKIKYEVNTSDVLYDTVLPSGVWHHIVATNNGTNTKLYLNGIEVGSSDSSGVSLNVSGSAVARIGARSHSSPSNYFNGNISELAFYNKGLSASEVKTLYNGREPYNHKEGVCSSNLQGWWRMGDGVLDKQPSNHTNSFLISDNTNATKGSNLWTETYSSNTGSWTADGTNSLTQENNAIKITGDGSDSDGARIRLRSTHDLSSDLTVGKLYELTFKSKVSSGSTVNVQFQISNAHSFVNFVNYTTEYKQFRHYFIATDATEAEIKCSAMGDGETIFMKDFSVREISGNAGVGENFDGSDIVGDTP